MTYFPFWLWMPAVGFEPWMVLLAQAWSLIYQFWIHTERIRKLPRPLECVLNTPSHHRVHHGVQRVYLDRNYGGILIIWDRMFGTYEPEGERVRYGLTKNIGTFNPVRVAFHEYIAMWHDIAPRRPFRDRLGILFRGPGWSPPGDRRRRWSRTAAADAARRRRPQAAAGGAAGPERGSPPPAASSVSTIAAARSCARRLERRRPDAADRRVRNDLDDRDVGARRPGPGRGSA